MPTLKSLITISNTTLSVRVKDLPQKTQNKQRKLLHIICAIYCLHAMDQNVGTRLCSAL